MADQSVQIQNLYNIVEKFMNAGAAAFEHGEWNLQIETLPPTQNPTESSPGIFVTLLYIGGEQQQQVQLNGLCTLLPDNTQDNEGYNPEANSSLTDSGAGSTGSNIPEDMDAEITPNQP